MPLADVAQVTHALGPGRRLLLGLVGNTPLNWSTRRCDRCRRSSLPDFAIASRSRRGAARSVGKYSHEPNVLGLDRTAGVGPTLNTGVDQDLVLNLRWGVLTLLEQDPPGAHHEPADPASPCRGRSRTARRPPSLGSCARSSAATWRSLHRLGLRVTAHARHRDAGVDRGADTRVEQVRLEEDLTVGDRDHVGGDGRRRRPPGSR